MKIILNLLLLAGVFNCNLLYAQEVDGASSKPTISLGAVVFPPYTLKNKEGTGCYGPFLSRAVEIFQSGGMDVNIVCAPAARIYRLIRSGDLDMTINVHSTKGILGHVDFFNRPFSFIELSLVSYADSTQKSVAAIRAFDYGGYRDKLSAEGYRFIDVPSAVDAVNIFLKKRSQHLITYKAPFDYMMGTLNVPEDAPIVTQRIAKVPTYFAVAIKSPHRAVINNWLAQFSIAMSLNTTFMNEDYMPAKEE